MLKELLREKKTSSRTSSTSSHTMSSSTESTEDSANCESCDRPYTNNEADSWIRCDTCESWWHYWYAGLEHILSVENEWMYKNCV